MYDWGCSQSTNDPMMIPSFSLILWFRDETSNGRPRFLVIELSVRYLPINVWRCSRHFFSSNQNTLPYCVTKLVLPTSPVWKDFSPGTRLFPFTPTNYSVSRLPPEVCLWSYRTRFRDTLLSRTTYHPFVSYGPSTLVPLPTSPSYLSVPRSNTSREIRCVS